MMINPAKISFNGYLSNEKRSKGKITTANEDNVLLKSWHRKLSNPDGIAKIYLENDAIVVNGGSIMDTFTFIAKNEDGECSLDIISPYKSIYTMSNSNKKASKNIFKMIANSVKAQKESQVAPELVDSLIKLCQKLLSMKESLIKENNVEIIEFLPNDSRTTSI